MPPLTNGGITHGYIVVVVAQLVRAHELGLDFFMMRLYFVTVLSQIEVNNKPKTTKNLKWMAHVEEGIKL